jgi:hypothetical protein
MVSMTVPRISTLRGVKAAEQMFRKRVCIVPSLYS